METWVRYCPERKVSKRRNSEPSWDRRQNDEGCQRISSSSRVWSISAPRTTWRRGRYQSTMGSFPIWTVVSETCGQCRISTSTRSSTRGPDSRCSRRSLSKRYEHHRVWHELWILSRTLKVELNEKVENWLDMIFKRVQMETSYRRDPKHDFLSRSWSCSELHCDVCTVWHSSFMFRILIVTCISSTVHSAAVSINI